MTRASLLTVVVSLAAISCDGETNAPASFAGTYMLIEENGDPIPSDPSAPNGCCVTLSGSATFTATAYDLSMSYRNKNNGITFDNSEQGTYTRQGRTMSFARTGGGGAGFPFLLGPGTVSADGASVTLLYGDEGPGSNQIRALFRR